MPKCPTCGTLNRQSSTRSVSISRKQLDLSNRDIDDAIEALRSLRNELPELIRRGRFSNVADGYGQGGSGGPSSGVSDPTGQAVLARQSRAEVDPVSVAVQAVCVALSEAQGLLRGAVHHARDISRIAKEAEGRPNSLQGTCECCAKVVTGVGDDRIRAGYCPACFKACGRWAERNGSRDRLYFEIDRRSSLVA